MNSENRKNLQKKIQGPNRRPSYFMPKLFLDEFGGNVQGSFKYSRPGRVWLVTSRLRKGKSLTLFLQCIFFQRVYFTCCHFYRLKEVREGWDGYKRCGHRSDMEVDLQSLFGLHDVHSCTHWLWTTQHLPIHWDSYTRALLVISL